MPKCTFNIAPLITSMTVYIFTIVVFSCLHFVYICTVVFLSSSHEVGRGILSAACLGNCQLDCFHIAHTRSLGGVEVSFGGYDL